MKTLNLGLTSKCNLSCEYCYQGLEGELSPEHIASLLVRHRPEEVLLGGGEPGIHPQFSEILGLSVKHARLQSISTNATFLYEELLKKRDGRLGRQALQNLQVQVSLPTIDGLLYKSITKSDIAVDEVVRNIKEYQKRFALGVNIPVYQANFDSLRETVSFLRANSLPVRISLAIPIGKGKDIKILNPKQLKDLTHYVLEQRVFDKNIFFNMHNNCPVLDRAYDFAKEDGSADCPAEAGEKLYIAPDGSAHGCEYLVPS